MDNKVRRQFIAISLFLLAILVAGDIISAVIGMGSPAQQPPIKNARATNQVAGLCSSSDGNRYATGFGVNITPTHTGNIMITGQMAFFTSIASSETANFYAFQSTNATIPNCKEIPTFGSDLATLLCSFDTLIVANGSNDVVVPIVCSNFNSSICPPSCSNALPLNKPAAVYFGFMNALGGGYTLTFSSPSSINVLEV